MNPTDAGNTTLETLMSAGLSRAACCRINDPNIHGKVLDNNPSTEELEIIAEVATSLFSVTTIIESKKLTENMSSIIFEKYLSGTLEDDNYYAPVNTFFEMLVRNKFWNDDLMRQLVSRKVFPEGRVPGQLIFWIEKLPEYANVPREWLETQIMVKGKES